MLVEDRPGSASDAEIPPHAAPFQRVDSFAEIQEIMKSTDFVQDVDADRRIFLGDTVLFVDGKEHLQRKIDLSPLFSKDAMIYYESRLLQPTIGEVMSELSARRGADGLARTDFVPLIRMMLYRIGARVAGIDGVDTPERTERLRLLSVTISEAVVSEWTTLDKRQVIDEGRAALRTLVDEYLLPSLERRRELVRQFKDGEIEKADLPRDVLTTICLRGDDVRPGDTAYDAYIWRETAFFLVASSHTTTLQLPHVPIHIAQWIAQHPEDAERVADPAFLRIAVGESLRLHQTAPARFRVATRDVTLSTGRKVAKGETLTLLAPRANLQTDVFGADAAEFNPYRKPPPGQQPWGLTFGTGAHMCMGRSLVTGLQNRADANSGTEGTMVKILKTLYASGAELDPDAPPRRMTTSFHDAYESVPIILRKL